MPTKPKTPRVVSTNSCCFLTDVHIKEADSQIARLFIGALESASDKGIETIVLMGDIFDFFFAATRYHHEKFKEIGAKLEELGAKGHKIFFIQGNHEFSLKKLRWKYVEVLTSEPLILEIAGKRIGVCHGDKFNPPLPYRIYLYLVSSWLFQTLVSWLPQKTLDTWCLSVSATSRSRDDIASMNHESILKGAEEWAERNDVGICVFGHFHIPYALKRPSGVKLVSCHDWSLPNVLLVKEGQFERHYLENSESNSRLKLPLIKKLRI